jgi:hypothetical protein
MENIQLGACDTVGRKLTKESTRDLFLSAVGVALFLIAFALARRAGLAGQSGLAIPAACAAAFFLGLAAWPFVRMARRSDDWGLSQAAMLAFFVFFNLDEKFPKGSAWRFGIVLLPLLPAGVLLWSYILPTFGWIWIAGVLVVSWTVGLGVASRRYR